MVFSVLLLCAGFSDCDQEVERPDSSPCLNNVPGLKKTCYNLKRDYDQNGELLKDAKPVVIQYKDEAAMLAALNKHQCFDPQSWANLKAYVKTLRDK